MERRVLDSDQFVERKPQKVRQVVEEVNILTSLGFLNKHSKEAQLDTAMWSGRMEKPDQEGQDKEGRAMAEGTTLWEEELIKQAR